MRLQTPLLDQASTAHIRSHGQRPPCHGSLSLACPAYGTATRGNRVRIKWLSVCRIFTNKCLRQPKQLVRCRQNTSTSRTPAAAKLSMWISCVPPIAYLTATSASASGPPIRTEVRLDVLACRKFDCAVLFWALRVPASSQSSFSTKSLIISSSAADCSLHQSLCPSVKAGNQKLSSSCLMHYAYLL